MIAWFAIVVAGRWPAGPYEFAAGLTRLSSRVMTLMEAMRMPMAYYIRADAYFYLITEDRPPFDPGTGVMADPAAPLPMATA